MNAGICSLVISSPLTMPQMSPVAIPAARPIGMPMCCVGNWNLAISSGVPESAIVTCAATTDDRIRTEPTERSIPAVMMTNVMPTVRTTSCDESMTMSLKLRMLKNLVPSRSAKIVTMMSRMMGVNVFEA